MRRRKRYPQKPDFEPIFRIAERIGWDEPALPNLLKAAISTESPHIRRQIEKELATMAVQRELQPFRSSTSDFGLSEDRIRLGTTITGSDYALDQDDLTQHLLAVGKSGAGKTTLFYNIMDQLTVPFWSFDLKQDYRHLVQDEDIDLLVLPWTALKFNPLQPPPGTRPRRWAQVFAEILGHATSLLSGSKNYLMKQLIKLYQFYGLLDEVAAPYPSLLELQVLCQEDKINYVRKTSNYRDTVLNRLEAMNRTAGSVFNCSQGHPIEDLLEQNVVFEFDGLSEDTQNFLMEILIAYVYEYRIAANQRGGDLRHVFFLDEGKRVFSVYKERQDAAGLPTIDELTAKMREFGEGLIVADQEASKLTDSIKANTDTKILLSTGDAKQFAEMAESMFLTDRQRELAKDVGIGEAIVQSGNRDPVPVSLEKFELDKSVTNTELREHQKQRWDRLSWEPRQQVTTFNQLVRGEDTEEVRGNGSGDGDQGIQLSDEAERLLEDVVEHPFKSLSERYSLFSSMEKGNTAKTELVSKGVVVERHVKARNRKRKLLEITKKGRAYLEEEYDIDVSHDGRGGIVHRFWQHTIKEVFEEAGWAAEVELFDADVYVNMADVELVVEVAMGDNPREIEHVEDHLETFDVVWVACRNEDVRDGLEQRLEENDALDDRVTFRLFRDFTNTEVASIE